MITDREIKKGPARDPTALGLQPTPELLGKTYAASISTTAAGTNSESTSTATITPATATIPASLGPGTINQ